MRKDDSVQILFNKTTDQCRAIGARGGRARAWNLRRRRLHSSEASRSLSAAARNSRRGSGAPGSPVPVA